MAKFYAGIGSRETPSEILELMTKAARALSADGWILRSGHAGGADLAFEEGSDPNLKEIYIPWRGFNGSSSGLYQISPEALEMAATFHPAWNRCSQGAQKLHARNCAQILGDNLHTPVDFVVCWTKDGRASGGTGQAMRLAQHHKIRIFNLYYQAVRDEVLAFCQELAA